MASSFGTGEGVGDQPRVKLLVLLRKPGINGGSLRGLKSAS
ncbi:MAG: hypothetical protein NTV94_01440 [Planctomycetota bacterium]|nr:hypothetical protein [Planctomycetota bacterium]